MTNEESKTALELQKSKFVNLGRYHKSSLDNRLVTVIETMTPKLEKDKQLLQNLVGLLPSDEPMLWTNTNLGSFSDLH